MKIIRYRVSNQSSWGVITEKGVLDIPAQLRHDEQFVSLVSADLQQTISYGPPAIKALQHLVETSVKQSDAVFLEMEQLEIEACVPNPGKIICVGLNYRRHALESNMPVPQVPILFNKYPNTLTGSGSTVLLPDGSEQNDYEAELAIVIGKRAKHVPQTEALDYVFGYCNVNDLSSRDWQMRTSQWLLGKSCDGFCPIGPYVVTTDEVPNPNSLQISCWVNGELRQNSNTSDMVFYCDEIVSYLSRHMTLEPGDLILTGTPEGVILGMPPASRKWLAEGDVVTVEVEGLGKLTNYFKNEF